MKAKKIKGTDPAGWVEQPKPVVDGWHRLKWKQGSQTERRGQAGVSCMPGPKEEEEEVDLVMMEFDDE